MGDSKLSASSLQACAPYIRGNGRYLQVAKTLVTEVVLTNTGETYLPFPGLEQANPSNYDFLCKSISAIVSKTVEGVVVPAFGTYLRVQWPDGRFLSNIPVDISQMISTGRNSRLLEVPKFCPKNSVTRLELGTSDTSGAPVLVQIFFEGCLLVPNNG